MVGPTAQLVALACHFNGRARGLYTGSFFPGNSTCQFCEHIHFLRRHPGGSEWMIAERTTEDWLDREAQPERRAIVMHQRVDDPRISDRMSAGLVGGGGRWLLHVVSGRQMNVWEARWQVGDRDAPDRRIWRVNYALIAENASVALPPPQSLQTLIAALQRTLSEILAFADRHHLETFAERFGKAMECLSTEDPFALVHHKDLAPDGLLGLPAKQVLAACQASWVFGGMGSWNDLGFEGEEQVQYEKVSDELFTLLNEGISAGANSVWE